MSASHPHHRQHATGAASLRPRPARVLACVAAITAIASTAEPAAAEKFNVTAQASAARAAFLAYAPAPAQAAALCLIDTGVNVNADTRGPVLLREANDGGSPDDIDSGRHGTLMAMVAGAPANDYGMVGAWPALRIHSIRAARPDGSYAISDYTNAINQCKRSSTQTGAKVINLSLGSQGELTQASKDVIDNAIEIAHQGGLNVVAAAGNTPGPLDSPASRPGAFAIGATNSAGALCTFSARGEGLDLSTFGCALNVAVPDTGEPGTTSGTSEAAAFTSAVLAALRSYDPELSAPGAEALLQRTARTTTGGLVLDVEAAFRADGLQSVIDAGNARIPADAPATASSAAAVATPPPPGAPGVVAVSNTPPKPSAPSALARLSTPRVRWSFSRGVLRLELTGRPSDATLRIDIHARNRRGRVVRVKTIHRASSTVSIRPVRTWDHVTLSYEDLYAARPRSRTVTVRHRAPYAGKR